MSMTDPISDHLIRIRNALIAKHDRVRVPGSKLKLTSRRLSASDGSFAVIRWTSYKAPVAIGHARGSAHRV